jgi:catechol 2,3-dioxygenase-like lactoylglutathione lyase family enzyme
MRRLSKSLLLSLILTLLVWLPVAEGQQTAPPVAVKAVSTIGFTVSNLDRSVELFTQALGFQKVSEFGVSGTEYEQLEGILGIRMRIARLRLGDELIELTEYLAPKGRPIPVPSYSHDRWFQHVAIVVKDMDKAYQHVKKFNLQQISPEPQTLPEWNLPAAGIKAFKFRDPDGHNLELLYFPPGKGRPKWHRPTDSLFLGIDHTAITIGNTAASLKFYRDLLGMKVAGESVNHGITQDRLDGLFGARVHITGISPPGNPPSIEFLEYQTPPGGRPMPHSSKSNDLWHWRTTLIVDDLETATKALRANGVQFVSSKPVEIPEKERFGFRKAILVQDPDGHVMRLVEK